ncbi:YagK/YfjJ domain-containing protein [Acinetobacter proteolyticus]|uniref:YagK/YfjJ C-terminal domain-containing protein n=1 Tax=Acinetobacter proteolyticus TaxID=1776741 RepID=A0A2N0WCH7_9GAMM|nr:inovirus-type Gp2 protein [Acinetobacter proteolyticus]PKF32175.1 hypothetical protein CW311_15275 [Acinetobacter proteolyticus]
MGVLAHPTHHRVRKPITSLKRPNIVSLDEDLDIFEANHGNASNILDKHHTLTLKDSLFTHNQEKGSPQVLPEDKHMYLHFLCLWITQRISSRDECFLYSKHESLALSQRFFITDSTLCNYYKQIFMSEDISEGDYKSEHYNCVIDAVSKFWPYRFDLINLWNAPSAKITIQDESGNSKQVTVAEILNQINFKVYKNIHGPVFKEAIRIRVRRAANHFKSAEKYLSELRKDNGRMVVIRVDLCLPQELKNIGVHGLKTHFDCFTQKMRRSSLLKLNGYIWKLEYGFAKSFHYHLIIFLCGRKHSHDIKLAQMIGEMWDKTVGGKNCYFNCHSTKHLKHYKDIVVGRLERNDHTKYDRLLNVVIRYFCKKDQFIVHKSILNKKTFDTGRTRSTRKNLGRPVKI